MLHTLSKLRKKIEPDKAIKKEWHCRFAPYGDKCELYLTEFNNCKTFKQLRRWWRINYPNYRLLDAKTNDTN